MLLAPHNVLLLPKLSVYLLLRKEAVDSISGFLISSYV